MNLIFMGSPAFAVPSLQALHAAGHTFAAIYTQPPRPAGRGQKLQPTAIQTEAERLGLGHLIHTPQRLKGDELDTVLATPCEAIVVVAYGLLLPKQLVDSRLCLNVHPSALPRWRGAAPLQHTLWAGDSTTEVCIMKLDAGMDTGPVYTRTPLAIAPATTYGELHNITAAMGAKQLVNVLANLSTLIPTPQTGDATLANKITADMRPLNPHRTATQLHNQVRALSPTPAATLQIGDETCKILSTQPLHNPQPSHPIGTLTRTEKTLTLTCAEGLLSIQTIQRPNKKPQSITEALNGWNLKI